MPRGCLAAAGRGRCVVVARNRSRRVARVPAPAAGGRIRSTPPFIIFRTLAPPEAHGRVAMLPSRAGDRRAPAHAAVVPARALRRWRGLCVVQEPRTTRRSTSPTCSIAPFTRGPRIELGRADRCGWRPTADARRSRSTAKKRRRLASVWRSIRSSSTRLGQRARRPSRVSRSTTRACQPLAAADRRRQRRVRTRRRSLLRAAVDARRAVSRGRIGRRRRLTTLRTGSPAKSLSPDGQHLVVKKPVGTASGSSG